MVGIFPQLYALYLTSRMLYSTMAGISNQSPTSSGTKRKPKLGQNINVAGIDVFSIKKEKE